MRRLGRAIAEQAGAATSEASGSQAVYVSRPDIVALVIRLAAKAITA